MTTTRQGLTFALLALALVGCQVGPTTHPVPSVAQIGADLHCSAGDHGYEDTQAGWGFCYPGTWKYPEPRSQATATPPGLDLTFNITDVPCESPAPGASARPVCASGAGLFALIVISTYFRGDSASLASWVQTNLNPQPTPSSSPSSNPSPSASPTPPPTLQPIQWGNATEAAMMADGRRIALTPHHVVILELRSGQGYLDLETPMSSRLGTWKFVY